MQIDSCPSSNPSLSGAGTPGLASIRGFQIPIGDAPAGPWRRLDEKGNLAHTQSGNSPDDPGLSWIHRKAAKAAKDEADLP